jgi:hypothetical protein
MVLVPGFAAGAAIVAAAEKQHQQEEQGAGAKGGSSSSSGVSKKGRPGSPSESWTPTLPAALAAWAAAKVAKPGGVEGVQQGRELLLQACAEARRVRQQQGTASGADAAGRKGKGAAAKGSSDNSTSSSHSAGLLQPVVVNAVLAAMLEAACSNVAAAKEAAAAAEAVIMQMLGCSIADAAAGVPLIPAAAGCLPDVHTWGLLVRLWGLAAPFRDTSSKKQQQASWSVTTLLEAACNGKLPVAHQHAVGTLTSSSDDGGAKWSPDACQELAAAGVAALRCAGRHSEAVGLLRLLAGGGVTRVTSDLLAAEVWTSLVPEGVSSHVLSATHDWYGWLPAQLPATRHSKHATELIWSWPVWVGLLLSNASRFAKHTHPIR